uniref:RING-type domain-containing protein n=1 Tax=viral metagenome TaxID=1070528 RepID=A0A6C0IAB8_9ZZZZ
MELCKATTNKGKPCKNLKKKGEISFCGIHCKFNYETCGICYEPFRHLEKLSECSHSMCKKCMSTWLITSPTCPFCRKTVTKTEEKNSWRNCLITGEAIFINIYHLWPDNLDNPEMIYLYDNLMKLNIYRGEPVSSKRFNKVLQLCDTDQRFDIILDKLTMTSTSRICKTTPELKQYPHMYAIY